MTARTLEETVSAIRVGLQYLDATNAKADRAIKAIDDLLAIAQEQRAQIARLQDNASTAAFDKVADQLGEANRENEEQRAEIERLRGELDEANECRDPAYFAQIGRKRER